MNIEQNKSKRRPVLPWFGAFFVMLGASLFAIDYFKMNNTLTANGVVLFSMVFLAKAGMNAAANAGERGKSGGASRNYLIRMLAVSVAYVGSIFAASTLIDEGDPITVLSVFIALVPGIAVAAYFWAIGKYLAEQQDEFLRMLLVRQSLIATGLAFSAASIWGFLENFDQVQHVDAYWWPILWFFGIGVGAIANKIQYGTIGEA